jgi:hypothetical protein
MNHAENGCMALDIVTILTLLLTFVSSPLSVSTQVQACLWNTCSFSVFSPLDVANDIEDRRQTPIYFSSSEWRYVRHSRRVEKAIVHACAKAWFLSRSCIAEHVWNLSRS